MKEIYREFLKSAPLVQKDRIESYFRDWKLVEDIDGPFENAYKQEKALKAVMKPSDFHVSISLVSDYQVGFAMLNKCSKFEV